MGAIHKKARIKRWTIWYSEKGNRLYRNKEIEQISAIQQCILCSNTLPSNPSENIKDNDKKNVDKAKRIRIPQHYYNARSKASIQLIDEQFTTLTPHIKAYLFKS